MAFLWSVAPASGSQVGFSPCLPSSSSPVCAPSAGPNVMVPAYGPSLLCAVLDAVRRAAERVALEAFAAERIQAAYRMCKARREYQRHRQAVLAMQRVYRGSRQRKATAALQTRESQRYDVYLFNYYATRIQAVFRGYASRKHRCDFYARKAYVDAVTEESEAVRALVHDFHEEQASIEALQSQMRESSEFARATAKVNHLLSTAATSGVYRRPLAMTGTATVFGTNVEEDIRRNAADARRPVIEAEMRKNASVPIRPAASSMPASRSTRATQRQKASTPPPAPALAATQPTSSLDHRPHSNDGTGATTGAVGDQRNGGGVGLAATLPPIRTRQAQAQAPLAASYYVPSAASCAPACGWENPDARPEAKPLVDPTDAVVTTTSASSKSKSKMKSATTTTSSSAVGRAPHRPAGPAGAAATSSFDKQFKVASHDCLGSGPAATKTSPGQSKTAAAARDATMQMSTYDTETAALQKSVDAKVVKSLHGDTVFKVRATKQ